MSDKRRLTEKSQLEFTKTAADWFGFGKAEKCHE